jgi:hypothetical protein
VTEVQDPYKILDGMREIARADMMDTVGYVTSYVDDPSRIHAICRGRKACAVGSAWLAAGVRLQRTRDDVIQGHHYLPGVEQGEPRKKFLSRRPALRRAFALLNEAAEAYIDRHNIDRSPIYSDALEALFESEDPALNGDKRKRAMLNVIASAKRKLKAADGSL